MKDNSDNCNSNIEEAAQLMLGELLKPENADLAEAVKNVGNYDGPNGNFIYGFIYLDEEQTERWEALTTKHCQNADTGASYGLMCRRIQQLLTE